MDLHLTQTPLRDLYVIEHQIAEDDRGFFMEVYRRDVFAEAGLPTDFQQINQSQSQYGVVRGLHFQWDPPMGKLMRVVRGTAFLVAVDIRKGSPTLGQWFGTEVSAESKKQLWGPAGFARGFCTLSDVVEVQYMCTAIYNPACEGGVLWSDPEIGITWPVKEPQLSGKDSKAPALKQWLASPQSDHFSFS